MNNISLLFRKMFLPRFIYEFRFSLPSDSYILNIVKKSKSLDLDIINYNDKLIEFYILSSKILGIFAAGKCLVSIKKINEIEYLFSIHFLYKEKVHRLVAYTVSCFALLDVILNGRIVNLTAIPIIFLIGHLWPIEIATKIQKFKPFFLDLDE